MESKQEKNDESVQTIGIGIVLDKRGKVLIDQRCENFTMGGFWEFPGGKKELGEDIKTCITRELMEELSIEVEVGEELIIFEHSYSNMKLSFEVYICSIKSGRPESLRSQQLKWVAIEDLKFYQFPEANIRIVNALFSKLHL